MSTDWAGQDMGAELRCTLILPTYNAADFVAGTVERINRFLDAQPDWCALFVCDGCSDGTAEKLTSLTRGVNRIRVESYERNRGKGYALRRGLNLARTPYRIFTDVDLAYDPDQAPRILELLENGADVGVVNRASPDSRFLMSPSDFPRIYKRHLMSRSFNWWLRQMLPIEILDTQAGLKGITARAWEIIGPQMKTDGFFFDVELLSLAAAAKLKVEESPVFVTYVDPTTTRMITSGWSMIKDTIRLRRRLKRHKIVHVDRAKTAEGSGPRVALRSTPDPS
jgi:glycosyltransferase involved in cell wall biosynthesis